MQSTIVADDLAARFDTTVPADLAKIQELLPMIESLKTELSEMNLRYLASVIIPTDAGVICWLRAGSAADQDVTAAIQSASTDRLALYIAMAAADVLPHIEIRRRKLSEQIAELDSDASICIGIANRMVSPYFRDALRTWPHRYEKKLTAHMPDAPSIPVTS